MASRIRHWALPAAAAIAIHVTAAATWITAQRDAATVEPPGIDLSLGLTGAVIEEADLGTPDDGATVPTVASATQRLPQPDALASLAESAPRVAEQIPLRELASATPQPATDPVDSLPASANPAPESTAASTTPLEREKARSGQAGFGRSVNLRGARQAKSVRAYFNDITAWIDANKDYPGEVKQKKQQGTVVVKFTIDRDGQLLAASVKKSSGHALLDQAAIATLWRAAPLPPIPDFIGKPTLSIAVPIEYSLITN